MATGPQPSVKFRGTIVRGHRVASGLANDPDFPEGTIRPQLAAIRAAIPDLEAYLGGPPFAGTINIRLDDFVSVAPGAPDFRVGPLQWTELFPPENFLISRALLQIGATHRPTFLYIPDPATKPAHRQPTNVVELLAAFIPGLNYGDPVVLGCAPSVLRT